MLIEGKIGPVVGADGTFNEVRLSRDSSVGTQDVHGRYQEAAYRGGVFYAASQAATTWSIALAATHTGLVLSNPAGSRVNLVVINASFALSVAPAAIAPIGLFGGYAVAGVVTHTTPLSPGSTLIGSPKSVGLADGAASLVGTPAWLQMIMGGFTAAALPATSPALIDLGGLYVIPPGGYVGIGALTAVVGFASICWEEIPL